MWSISLLLVRTLERMKNCSSKSFLFIFVVTIRNYLRSLSAISVGCSSTSWTVRSGEICSNVQHLTFFETADRVFTSKSVMLVKQEL